MAVLLGVLLFAIPFVAHAQESTTSRGWNQPVPPFHIIGNIYYVGANEITSFFIKTSAGGIVIDGGFEETAPQIEANVQKLGSQLGDVKILLNSHAHFDHAGGLAEIKSKTGAQLVAMYPDSVLLANGGRGDFFLGDRYLFPAIAPDRVIHDGDTVTLGDTTLTAHLTPGHTQGCTTWTMSATDAGKA